MFFQASVAALQEIAITPEFQEVRDGFLAEHVHTFEDTEENKLEYMMVFQQWVSLAVDEKWPLLSATPPHTATHRNAGQCLLGVDKRRSPCAVCSLLLPPPSPPPHLAFSSSFAHTQTGLIEGYLDRSLTARVAGFSMGGFVRALGSRQDQMDAELFEMLASLADFSVFKEEILSFKQAQSFDAGGAAGMGGGGGFGLVVHGIR
jgi:hypothetical protein